MSRKIRVLRKIKGCQRELAAMMRSSNMGILPYGLSLLWLLGGFLFKHRCIHQREHSVTTLLTGLSCSNIGVFTKEDITLPGHPACMPAASSSGNPDWPGELLIVNL